MYVLPSCMHFHDYILLFTQLTSMNVEVLILAESRRCVKTLPEVMFVTVVIEDSREKRVMVG